jgi:superfamily II DNA or RNA helicase
MNYELETAGAASERPVASEGLRTLNLSLQYHSSFNDLVSQFYLPCLMRSCSYDRAAGFFRSSILHLVGDGLVSLTLSGGRIRLVCSPDLARSDAEAISMGYEHRSSLVESSILSAISGLAADASTKQVLVALATLVSLGSMDIKLAVPSAGGGLYHEKLGIFSDMLGDSVSFRGSANETVSAWAYWMNVESFEVFCSWGSGSDSLRVIQHKDYFERLWNDSVPHIKVIDFPEASKRELVRYSLTDIDLIDLAALRDAGNRRRPFPHQVLALESWRNQDCEGILDHATGSGKTYTALLAIKEHARSGMPTLIIVPNKILLDQWYREVMNEMPDAVILRASGEDSDWKQPARLRAFLGSNSDLPSRLVIGTYESARSSFFLSIASQAKGLLLVADEVHRSGSLENRRIFQIVSAKRLGLSATPTRFGDPEGSKAIMEYFGEVLKPPFGLADAISAGRLVRYYYYPHLVNLSPEEYEDWKALTKKVSRRAAIIGSMRNTEGYRDESMLLLLVQRARIAKKASAKVGLASAILKEHYSDGQRWLIYCDDLTQLRKIRQRIELDLGIEPLEYHYEMLGDRRATLDWFARQGGVILSVRCLDEGVDIPDATHALILASSQNSREFIQRRGRVLRVTNSGEKPFAVIHDAVVVPASIDEHEELDALLKAEIARVLEFSKTSENPAADLMIGELAALLGVHPEDLVRAELQVITGEDRNAGIEEAD